MGGTEENTRHVEACTCKYVTIVGVRKSAYSGFDAPKCIPRVTNARRPGDRDVGGFLPGNGVGDLSIQMLEVYI